jgi:hypothetical protein
MSLPYLSQFVSAEVIGYSREGQGDETYGTTALLLEITDADGHGQVELAFNCPKTKIRHYVKFSLGELVATALKQGRSTE